VRWTFGSGIEVNIDSGIPNGAAGSHVLRESSGTLLLGTGSGVYRSTNDAASWSLVLAGSVGELEAISPGSVGIYAIAGGNLRTSVDGGASWSSVDATGLPASRNAMAVDFYGSMGAIVARFFVGTSQGVYCKDGSNPWVAFNGGLGDTIITSLAIHPNGNILHAGTSAGTVWHRSLADLSGCS